MAMMDFRKVMSYNHPEFAPKAAVNLDFMPTPLVAGSPRGTPRRWPPCCAAGSPTQICAAGGGPC
jgi:hypothetical protein